jgi:hypothetical protein
MLKTAFENAGLETKIKEDENTGTHNEGDT